MGLMNLEKKGNGQTVLVGVKLDSNSRELLTWALVKVAQPGDKVIALHVMKNNQELLSSDGKSSSLLSLVKAFDSILAVYEGFCNLKQVDLKLKISRGSSIRKVLVQEAKFCEATKVIVGITRKNAIGSSVSIAKYCARNLARNCLVLAVNNGKVVFQREATTANSSQGNETENRPKTLLGALHRTLSKNSKVLSSNLEDLLTTERENDKSNNTKALNQENYHDSENNDPNERLSCNGDSKSYSLKPNCSICAPGLENKSPVNEENDRNCNGSFANQDQSLEDEENNPLALVPVQTLEATSSSITLLIKEMPELRPGWPLLRRSILLNGNVPERSESPRKISVVQWAMRLPNRNMALVVHPDHQKPKTEGVKEEQEKPNLDGESRAILPVGIVSPPSRKNSDGRQREIPKELETLHEKFGSTCRLFSYQELLLATSMFSLENLIGKGGSSRVYKGFLPDGKEVAVKILKHSEDAWKEFVLEIEIITVLNHKNIVSLFGFCFEDNNLFLVFNFLSRGSLEENLHGNKGTFVLPWAKRYKVAVGVAEALDYLHTQSSQPVIHRDVKSSNILLSDEFEPQLSDFGLAKWASTTSSYTTCSDVAGTFGYLAPEYFMYGKVNEKIDVYSFGVVLLELLTGRKPISSEYPKGQESLVMWPFCDLEEADTIPSHDRLNGLLKRDAVYYSFAMPLVQSGKVLDLFDPSLGGKYDDDQMQRMMLAASLCIRRSPRFRPQMGLILKLLQGDEDVIKRARVQVKAVEEIDRLDDELHRSPNIQSHLNLALLDVEDDLLSIGSIEQSVDYLTAHKSFEDYLQGRWSRSSSFD